MDLPKGVTRCATCRGNGMTTVLRYKLPLPLPVPVQAPCGPCGGSGHLWDWEKLEEEARELAEGRGPGGTTRG